jgi:hypothetical protein
LRQPGQGSLTAPGAPHLHPDLLDDSASFAGADPGVAFIGGRRAVQIEDVARASAPDDFCSKDENRATPFPRSRRPS